MIQVAFSRSLTVDENVRRAYLSGRTGRATDTYKILFFLFGAIPLIAACSTTPGDAAYRQGSFEVAAELYFRGALNGDDKAALKLGLLLENRVIDVDRYKTATAWFGRACELGNIVGCHNAGVSFEYGKDGFERDYVKASNYYQKAADYGYMQSQYNIGSMYANRYLADDIKGLQWLLLAQKNAAECASEELCQWILKDPPGHVSKLKERMTKEQIEEAQQSAAKFSPVN